MADERALLEHRLSTIALARTEALVELGMTIKGDPIGAALDATISAAPLAHISIGPTSTDLSIVKTLGEGGMGRVHLARQRSLERDVAVKTLKSEASQAVGAALLREARITGSLEHPGVIPVHALGADERGWPLLVMKRVEGVDLGELLRDDAHPIWDERTSARTDRLAAKLEIMLQVCRTIEFAHARGVIHRDIKPDNVMVGRYGEVYLLDWGIATRKDETSDAQRLVGTPAFMAPEMFLGGVIDERTDVYLLGATLHNVLTGRFRHEGKNLLALATSAVESKPVTYEADVPSSLAELCNRATARDPAARPQTAQAFRESVVEFLLTRSAMALSDVARDRLALLESLFAAAGDEKPPSDLAKAYRLATEARFGFAESLRERPEHADAIEGARAAVVALCELELRQGHADTAEAVLREIDAPDAALLTRIADVRARDAARRKDAERLKALDQDRDPSIGFSSRFLLSGLFLGSAIVGSALVYFRAIVITSAWGAAALLAGLTPIGLALSWFLRKRIFATAYSTTAVASVYISLAICLLDRIACAIGGGSIPDVLTSNLWVAATALATAGVAVEKRLFAGVVPLVPAAFAMRIWSDRSTEIFSIAVVVSVAASLAFLFWGRKERPDAKVNE
jgi:serine/threonine-protein kinase